MVFAELRLCHITGPAGQRRSRISHLGGGGSPKSSTAFLLLQRHALVQRTGQQCIQELEFFCWGRCEDELGERCKTLCHEGTGIEWREEKDGLTFSPERAARKGDRPS